MSSSTEDYHQFQGDMNTLNKLIHYPAAERNKKPILDIFQRILQLEKLNDCKTKLKALEIGSGSGQHVAHFAAALPYIDFQPTDLDGELFRNIIGFRDQFKLTNILDPVKLDLTTSPEQWLVPAQHYDLMYCSNVLHISPFETSIGLFSGARRCLKLNTGLLIIYGPFAVDGLITPQSNIDFDRSLRERNASWGIRDVKQLNELAKSNGMELKQIFDMPANNKVLFFKFV